MDAADFDASGNAVSAPEAPVAAQKAVCARCGTDLAKDPPRCHCEAHKALCGTCAWNDLP